MLRTVGLIIGAVLISAMMSSPSLAITYDPFGPNGEGGSINGQNFTLVPGGAVFELDAFLNIAGQDLNGGAFGTSAQMSLDPLPVGLNYSFSSALSPDTTDLTLTYSFLNNTGASLSGVQFFSFLDAEIDEPINTFFNEFGGMSGTAGAGSVDSDPDSWEIDEPGLLTIT